MKRKITTPKQGQVLAMHIAFKLLCCLFFAVKTFSAHAQVTATINVIPPYSPYISDYFQYADKTIIQLISTAPKDVKLAFTLTGDNGITVTSNASFSPIAPLHLNTAIPYLLTGLDLLNQFDKNHFNISGANTNQIIRTGIIPEGYYTLCISVYDYYTNELLSSPSPSGCTNFNLILPEPPLLTSPLCADSIVAKSPQFISFTWTRPANSPALVNYTFKLIEVIPADRNINDAMQSAAIPPLYEITTPSNVLVYGPGEPPLESGKHYAWRVTATDALGKAIFENGGRSEVCDFYYRINTVFITPILDDLTEEVTTTFNTADFGFEVLPFPPLLYYLPETYNGRLVYNPATATGSNAAETPESNSSNSGSVNVSSNENLEMVVTDVALYQAKPMAYVTAKLAVIKYIKIETSVFSDFKTGNEYFEVEQILATDITDANGNFNFIVNLPSDLQLGRLNENEWETASGENKAKFTGEVYRTIRVIVDDPKYASPADNFDLVQNQSKDLGTLTGGVRYYDAYIGIESSNTYLGKELSPDAVYANGPLAGVEVFLCRKNPLYVNTPYETTITDSDMECYFGFTSRIIAKGFTDISGNIVFKNLVRNKGYGDNYWLCFKMPLDFNYYTYPLSFQNDFDNYYFPEEDYNWSICNPGNGFGPPPNIISNALNSAQYVFAKDYTNASITLCKSFDPQPPVISGKVVRTDVMGQPLPDANITIYTKELITYQGAFGIELKYELPAFDFAKTDAFGNFEKSSPHFCPWETDPKLKPVLSFLVNAIGYKDYNNGNPTLINQGIPVPYGKRQEITPIIEMEAAGNLTGTYVFEPMPEYINSDVLTQLDLSVSSEIIGWNTPNPEPIGVSEIIALPTTIDYGTTTDVSQDYTVNFIQNIIQPCVHINLSYGASTYACNGSFNLPFPTSSQIKLVVLLPDDNNFFPDTTLIFTNVSEQDIGERVLKRKIQRAKFVVTEKENPSKPIANVKVKINELNMEGFTNSAGFIEFYFMNAETVYTISIEAPVGSDYIAPSLPLTAEIKVSKNLTVIPIALQKGTSISGHVYENETPLADARIYLADDINHDAFSSADGSYILHGVLSNNDFFFYVGSNGEIVTPQNTTTKIIGVKSNSNLVGDSLVIHVPATGVTNADLHLQFINGMDVSTLLGFDVEAVTAKVNNDNTVSISGNIVHVPDNTLFAFAKDLIIPFTNIKVKPSYKIGSKGLPLATPVNLPVSTDVTSVYLQTQGTGVMELTGTSGKILLDSIPGFNGVLKGKIQLGLSLFHDPNIAFPNGKPILYNDDVTKPQIAAAASGYTFPAQLKLAAADGKDFTFKLLNFDITASKENSYWKKDSVCFSATLHTNIPHVTPNDIAAIIGTIRYAISPEGYNMLPLHSTNKIAITNNTWKLENTSLSFYTVGGLQFKTGNLITPEVTVPFTDLTIYPTSFNYGTFDMQNITLGGFLPVTVSGKADFSPLPDYTWQLYLSTPAGFDYCATIQNLDKLHPMDVFYFKNMQLVSNGKNTYGIDQKPVTYNSINTFTPTSLPVVLDNMVKFPGIIDLHIPDLNACNTALIFTPVATGNKADLQSFGFTINTQGISMLFEGNGSYPLHIDNGKTTGRGVIYEQYGTKKLFNINGNLTHDLSNSDFIIEPNQSWPFSEGKTIANAEGIIKTEAKVWKPFQFEGDVTGANGTTAHWNFVVNGDIVANDQEAGVKNISTPFGDLDLVYDPVSSSLRGNLEVHQLLTDGTQVDGTAEILFGSSGWYFLGTGSMKLTNPYQEGSIAMLFGNYTLDNYVREKFQSASKYYALRKKLPSTFPDKIAGFYTEGALTVPDNLLIIPNFDFDFIIFSAEFNKGIGGDARMGMNFTNDALTFSTGYSLFVWCKLSVGASVGLAGATLLVSADMEQSSDGLIKIGSGTVAGPEGIMLTNYGDWYVEGDAELSIGGEACACFGGCDSDCESLLGLAPCADICKSKYFTVGLYVLMSMSVQKFEFYFE